jgi:heme/copper-type cytochrome/quinol oxidase subunit 4
MRARAAITAFLALLALTALELTVIHLDATRAARITDLAGLAMTKAAVVLMFFMNLRSESKPLRFTALLPLLVAPGFAVVLMLEAAYHARLG